MGRDKESDKSESEPVNLLSSNNRSLSGIFHLFSVLLSLVSWLFPCVSCSLLMLTVRLVGRVIISSLPSSFTLPTRLRLVHEEVMSGTREADE